MNKYFRLGIVGSRSWKDSEMVKRFVRHLKTEKWILVSGGCKDSPDGYAEDEFDLIFPFLSKEKLIFYPDWNLHGKKAGLIRNKDISRNSDFLVSFWDPESSTSGCLNTCKTTQDENRSGIIVIPSGEIIYINSSLEQTKNILNGRVIDFFVHIL